MDQESKHSVLLCVFKSSADQNDAAYTSLKLFLNVSANSVRFSSHQAAKNTPSLKHVFPFSGPSSSLFRSSGSGWKR